MLKGLSFAALAALAFSVVASAGEATIERVVVVQRHGVRAPTKSSESLSKYSREPWRVWPVSPGELTPHGADGAQAMGASLNTAYTNLLSADDCDTVYVWADSGDTRTRESGDAAARGLRPGCKTAAHHAAATIDPLFSPDDAGLCPPKAADVRAAALKLAGGDINALGPTYTRAKEAMAAILYPGLTATACRNAPHGACLFVTGSNAFTGEGWETKIDGPLAVGSSLSENLLLEYAQGFDAPGWGRAATPAAIDSVMELHNLYARLTRANPVVAARKGAILATEIEKQLTNPAASAGTDTAIPVPAKAKLVLFLGHDGNLSNLAGIYGLNWQLDGQPDATAPNTALVFERIRANDGKKYVRIKILYQTLADMRTPAPKTRTLALRMADCHDGPDGSCALDRFARITRAHIAPDCLPHR